MLHLVQQLTRLIPLNPLQMSIIFAPSENQSLYTMAHTQSAKKRIRQTIARTAVNRSVMSRVRTLRKKVDAAVDGIRVGEKDGALTSETAESTMGAVKAFGGNFLVVVRALTYILTLGKEGIPEAAKNAVLNANYMMSRLKDLYTMAYDVTCMHEFVMTLEKLHDETGVSALDLAKGLLDNGIHPPTMYFPLIVHEALMIEPTETESKQSIDEAAEVFRALYKLAYEDPQALHDAPVSTPVRRLDEVRAANPKTMVLKYEFAQA